MASMTLAAARAEIKSNPGKVYVYVLSRPCGTPFYVGVGTGRRVAQHERYVGAGLIKAPVHAIIHDLKSAGNLIGYAIAGWFDDWTPAATEERRLIALYGRADLGLGTLANRTNGGQGTAGIDWYRSSARAEGARKAAEKLRGRKLSVEHRAKIGAAHKGLRRPPETGAKISARFKGKPLTAEHRAKLSAAKKGRQPSQSLLDGGQRFRDGHASEISERRIAQWNDPAYRERMSKAMTGVKRRPDFVEANRARQKRKFLDPEFRRRWNAARLSGLRSAEAKARMSQAAKSNWSNPMFQKRMKAARAKARQTRRNKEN